MDLKQLHLERVERLRQKDQCFRYRDVIVIQEIKGETLGSHVWPSAIKLADFLWNRPNLVAGKRCLELGAGCGLAGLCASYLKAESCLLTDLPHVMNLLEANVKRNNFAQTKTRALDWLDPESFSAKFEVVLLADVVYYDQMELFKGLVQTLLQVSEGLILMAYKERDQKESAFFDLMEKAGLVSEGKEAVGEEHWIYKWRRNK
jgi:hypothetical protein